MTFYEILMMCAGNPEFVAGFNRLTGYKLTEGTPLEQAIDRATGFEEAGLARFVEFVHDTVWTRLAAPERCAPASIQ